MYQNEWRIMQSGEVRWKESSGPLAAVSSGGWLRFLTSGLTRWRVDIEVNSWNPQNLHLKLLLNLHTKFQVPSSIWREVMRGTKSEIKGKNDQKTTFLGLLGNALRLKGRPLLLAHLYLLLNLHTKFQLPNSIWREKGEEHAPFKVKMGGNPSYLPP